MKPLDFPLSAARPAALRRRNPLLRRRMAMSAAFSCAVLLGMTWAQPARAQKSAASPASAHKGAAGAKAAPSPVASPSPAAVAAPEAALPSPSVAATPAPEATPADPAAQKLNKEAREVIVAAYYTKLEPYQKAVADFDGAGGISAATFKSKEDIAARRKLLDALNAINEEHITFLKTEPDVLRMELGKVGMPAAKIDQYAASFTPDEKTALTLEARTHAKESFQAMGEALNFLEESWGRWTTKEGRISFKKPADVKKYSGIITAVSKAQTAQNAAVKQLQAMSASAGSPAPAASPDAAASPK